MPEPSNKVWPKVCSKASCPLPLSMLLLSNPLLSFIRRRCLMNRVIPPNTQNMDPFPRRKSPGIWLFQMMRAWPLINQHSLAYSSLNFSVLCCSKLSPPLVWAGLQHPKRLLQRPMIPSLLCSWNQRSNKRRCPLQSFSLVSSNGSGPSRVPVPHLTAWTSAFTSQLLLYCPSFRSLPSLPLSLPRKL